MCGTSKVRSACFWLLADSYCVCGARVLDWPQGLRALACQRCQARDAHLACLRAPCAHVRHNAGLHALPAAQGSALGAHRVVS